MRDQQSTKQKFQSIAANVAHQIPALIPLHEHEYFAIRDLVYKRFGINLTEQKKSLIVGRLQKVLRQHGFKSFSEYHDFILSDTTGDAIVTLVNRITTNHTFFFRESDHFKFFVEIVLPEIKLRLQKVRGKKIRIWCAGCSSGEEPYTLAMLILEFFRSDIDNWDVALLATDISNAVLELAKHGIYTEENVSRLPVNLRQKYFTKTPDGNWRVTDNVRRLIRFGRFNLMRTDFPFKGTFQGIFCRNVMIYFDTPTKHALVERFYKFSEPNGYLFIGHSETLGRQECPYKYIRPAVYRKEA